MLTAAATCPATPLLVPALAGAAVAELAELRAACHTALRELSGAADLLVLLAPAEVTGTVPPGTPGGLAAYGVDLPVTAPPGPPTAAPPAERAADRLPAEQTADRLPVDLAVGAWLLREAGWSTPVLSVGVRADLAPEAATELGRELAGRADRVGVLALGEGSARRRRTGPGGWDERAEPFDVALAEALARADTAALTGLDPDLAGRLMVTGRAPWQVLAGAAGTEGGRPLTGRLHYAAAPYGVSYLVAVWTR